MQVVMMLNLFWFFFCTGWPGSVRAAGFLCLYQQLSSRSGFLVGFHLHTQQRTLIVAACCWHGQLLKGCTTWPANIPEGFLQVCTGQARKQMRCEITTARALRRTHRKTHGSLKGFQHAATLSRCSVSSLRRRSCWNFPSDIFGSLGLTFWYVFRIDMKLH